MQAITDMPVHSVIGNHDVWGWGIDDPSLEDDPRYGKAWAVEALGLPGPYYAFELGNWQFLALDSTHRPTLKPDDLHGGFPTPVASTTSSSSGWRTACPLRS